MVRSIAPGSGAGPAKAGTGTTDVATAKSAVIRAVRNRIRHSNTAETTIHAFKLRQLTKCEMFKHLG